LYPDNIKPQENIAASAGQVKPSVGLSPKVALATSAFWLTAIAFLADGFSQVGTVQNQVPHLQDIGFPLASAAAAMSATGLGSLFGKFFFGWLSDKIKPKYACAIGFVLQLTAILILINVNKTTPVSTIWLYAIIMGLGMGSWLPTMSMLISTNFGLVYYGAIFGMTSLAQSIGGSAGPAFAGFMFDRMGSYHIAFIVLVSLFAVALPAILLVRTPKARQVTPPQQKVTASSH
jgi:MFS family permease